MNSQTKILLFLEQIQDLDDQELADAIPMASARIVRGTLAAVARAVPDDAALLDRLLEQGAEIMLAMRGDDRIAAAAAPAELTEATT